MSDVENNQILAELLWQNWPIVVSSTDSLAMLSVSQLDEFIHTLPSDINDADDNEVAQILSQAGSPNIEQAQPNVKSPAPTPRTMYEPEVREGKYVLSATSTPRSPRTPKTYFVLCSDISSPSVVRNMSTEVTDDGETIISSSQDSKNTILYGDASGPWSSSAKSSQYDADVSQSPSSVRDVESGTATPERAFLPKDVGGTKRKIDFSLRTSKVGIIFYISIGVFLAAIIFLVSLYCPLIFLLL